MKLGLATIFLLACATSSTNPDAPPSNIDGKSGGSADARPDGATVAAMCPDGQYATAIAANGAMTCATTDEATGVAVRSRCSVYMGQHDSCTGCADPPTKWSANGPLACSPGAGAGNTCLTATLDDPQNPASLATLDLDGDVNGDDKFYSTLHCVTAAQQPRPAPCAPGWAIHGKDGDTWMCAPVAEAAVGYVRSKCALYFAWHDSCGSCADAPTKWGFANDTTCMNGAGGNDTCTTTTLGGENVKLFGLSTDGDVNDDDKFYVGLACDPTAGAPSDTKTSCPDGQFVVATNADGTFHCADPAVSFAGYMGGHCALMFGWHDSCDACTQPPSKWGKVTTGACLNGGGVDNTCGMFALGAANVPMFGLNTDGNVNGDDTFYFGLRCTP
ncbi:MAG TPA: hypothetical protein VL463_11210 [Kofleriaceae bacterium]|nr:hypothetical protein [Kofleriaceae bacterium]